MKRRNFLRIGCVLLGVLLLGVSAGRAAVALGENKQLRDGFVKHPHTVYQYEEHIPMEEMDLSKFPGNLSHLAYIGSDTVITLNRDICYYDKANAQEPTLVLKKGTEVLLGLKGPGMPPFYAYSHSMPTYVQGWRFTRPVLENGKTEADLENLPAYYVRLDDLRHLIYDRARFNKQQNPDLAEPMPSKEEFDRVLLSTDSLYYEKGVYISPDLLRNPMDEWNILLTALGVVLIAAGIVAHKIAKRKQGAQTAQK